MIHETAIVDQGASVSSSAKIWHWTHVMDGAIVGKNTSIGQGCNIAGHVGSNCKIQNNVSVYKGVIIENNVFLGPSCVFTNVKKPRANTKQGYATTIVHEGATIGANATIVCGVTIGDGAMIGAGSVITKDVPAGETWVGNPGHKIKEKSNGF